jgi:hypothetical protein
MKYLMAILVLLFTLCIIPKALAKEDYGLMTAKQARKETAKSIKINGEVAKGFAWTDICNRIDIAIDNGLTSTTIEYSKEKYPEFEQRLISLGYKVEQDPTTSVFIVSW